MKRILLYCFLGFMFLSLNLKAQIEDEIKSFVDSTEVLVNNGRKMLLNKILDEDYVKAREVYQYLLRETDGKNYAAFYYTEELYINFLLEDWSKWIENAIHYKDRAKAMTYPGAFPISDRLYVQVAKKADSIMTAVEHLDITPEDKSVLSIYVHLINVSNPDNEYNEMVKTFHKQHPQTSYEDFLKFYLPKPAVKGSWSWTIGAASVLPTGKLKDNFSGDAAFYIATDFNFGKVYTSLHFTFGSLGLQQPFTAYTETQQFDFEYDESFSFLEGGFLVGYFFVRNDLFHIAPYVSILGSSLTSDRFDEDEDEKEIEIYDSFAYGSGLHTELKLFDLGENSGNYGFGEIGSYISIKLEGGYNMITSFKHDEFQGNTAYLRLGLVWGLGSF